MYNIYMYDNIHMNGEDSESIILVRGRTPRQMPVSNPAMRRTALPCDRHGIPWEFHGIQ